MVSGYRLILADISPENAFSLATQRERNRCKQQKMYMANADQTLKYLTQATFNQLALGSFWLHWHLHWVHWHLRWVSRGFGFQHVGIGDAKSLMLGFLPNANPKREWFYIAVEYRLNSSHVTPIYKSSNNDFKDIP